MTKAENTVMDSRNPAEYIEASLKSHLSPAAKARLARLWMAKTGYTKEDILKARNRHPYWRKKKMEGSVERTRRRLEAHNYSGGSDIEWNRERVEEFLSMNGKGKDGRYETKDWQIAEHFGSTIPSVQYMRRKCRKVSSLLGPRASRTKIVDYLLRAESVLKRGVEAVETLTAAEKAKAKAGAKIPSKIVRKPVAKPKAAGKIPTAPAKKLASKTAVAKKPAAKKVAKAAGPKKPAVAPKKKTAAKKK